MVLRVALMTADDVRNLLRRACEQAGTAAAWAAKHDLSAAYVSDAMNGRRDPGPAICKALGLTSETNYRKAKP
jgi:hypothetical protein